MVCKSQINGSLSALFCGEGRRVAVLHAFIDESGTHAGAIVLSVAGFYGSGNQWRKFRNLWRDHSKGFHAKNSSSMFPNLCSAIEHSRVDGLLVTVNSGSYRKLASDHMKSSLGNAYACCALLCASSICRQSAKRISIVLEQGQPNVSHVKGILEFHMETGDLPIAAVATARKEDFMELQAADFLSHIASTGDVKWMQRLFAAGRLAHGHLTEKVILESNPEVTKIQQQAKWMRRAARTKEPRNP